MAPDSRLDKSVVDATERWFVNRGLPHFISGYNASQDIWTRAVPALTALFLLELLLASKVGWPWWLDLLAIAGAITIAITIWAIANRARGRPLFSRPDDLGLYEVAVFVVVPAIVPAVFGRQFLQGLVIAVSNVLLVALIYAATSYGIVPMTRWGLVQVVRQLESVFSLFFRALPLLILVLALLLFTTEVWQTAADLDALKMVLVIAMFAVIGTAFAVVRVPRQVQDLSTFESWERTKDRGRSTPIVEVLDDLSDPGDETQPLTRRQWNNVGLVVLVSEAVQVALVTILVFVFFVVFGMISLSQAVMRTWVGHDVDVVWRLRISGETFVLTSELLKVAVFLGAFSGLYFMVVLLTDATYREEFLEQVVSDVRDAFAVRAIYLAYLCQAA